MTANNNTHCIPVGNSVLEKAKRLKDETQWEDVYINKDMTEAERKAAYLLRLELRERRREEGDRDRSNFVIHRGRVIEKTANGKESRTPRDGIPQNEETNRPDESEQEED